MAMVRERVALLGNHGLAIVVWFLDMAEENEVVGPAVHVFNLHMGQHIQKVLRLFTKAT